MYVFKGITSRICRLRFASIQSWPLVKAHALLVVPQAYDLAIGLYVFYRVPHLTPCPLLLVGGPHNLAQRLMPRNVGAQQNKKIQAEGRVTATHVLWIISDD